jgi:hypothetical protein
MLQQLSFPLHFLYGNHDCERNTLYTVIIIARVVACRCPPLGMAAAIRSQLYNSRQWPLLVARQSVAGVDRLVCLSCMLSPASGAGNTSLLATSMCGTCDI